MINLFKKTIFTIQAEEWTTDDESNLKDYLASPSSRFLMKKLHHRINNRTEDLVNGQDTRKQIEELKDLILELESYADPA